MEDKSPTWTQTYVKSAFSSCSPFLFVCLSFIVFLQSRAERVLHHYSGMGFDPVPPELLPPSDLPTGTIPTPPLMQETTS